VYIQDWVLRQYGPDEEWSPTFVSRNDPHLERAIQDMLDVLESWEPPQPPRPSYEDRTPASSSGQE